jgi:hypothetical protein
LENGVSVLAVISDDNNPIQPEGNTQQLQDFDKVFIQLTKSTHRLTAGDFEMNAPQDGYFLRYHKRSRGLQFVDASKTGGMMHHVGERWHYPVGDLLEIHLMEKKETKVHTALQEPMVKCL